MIAPKPLGLHSRILTSLTLQAPDSSQEPAVQTMPLLPTSVAGTTEYVDTEGLTLGQACAPIMAGNTVMTPCCLCECCRWSIRRSIHLSA